MALGCSDDDRPRPTPDGDVDSDSDGDGGADDGGRDADGDADSDTDIDTETDTDDEPQCSSEAECAIVWEWNECCPCPQAASREELESQQCWEEEPHGDESPSEECVPFGCDGVLCPECEAAEEAACDRGACINVRPGECRISDDCGKDQVCLDVDQDGNVECVADENECESDEDCEDGVCGQFDLDVFLECWHSKPLCDPPCSELEVCLDCTGTGEFACFDPPGCA